MIVSAISWLFATKSSCESSPSYFSSFHSTGTNIIFENLIWGWFEDIRFAVTKRWNSSSGTLFFYFLQIMPLIFEKFFHLMINSQKLEPYKHPITRSARSGVKVRSNHFKHLKNIFCGVYNFRTILWPSRAVYRKMNH